MKLNKRKLINAKCINSIPRTARCISHSHGMTIIEVLVALTLLAIIFALVFLPFTKSLELMRRARAMGALESAMALAMRQMEQELSNARIIYRQRQIDLLDGKSGDDDRYGRLDFVTVASQASTPLAPSSQVITYYGRTRDPNKPFSLKAATLNPRILYRAEYWADQFSAQPNSSNSWYSPNLELWIDQAGETHNAITPLDGTDLAELHFHIDTTTQPMSIVIDMTLQKYDPVKKFERDPTTGKVRPAMLRLRRKKRVWLNEWTELVP